MSKRLFDDISPNVIVIVPTSIRDEGQMNPKKPKIGEPMTPPLPPLTKKNDSSDVPEPPPLLPSGNIAVPTQTVLPKSELDDSIKTSQRPCKTIAEIFKCLSSSACNMEEVPGASTDAEKMKCVVENIKTTPKNITAPTQTVQPKSKLDDSIQTSRRPSKTFAEMFKPLSSSVCEVEEAPGASTDAEKKKCIVENIQTAPKSWATTYLASLGHVYKPIKLNLFTSKMPAAEEESNVIRSESNEESTKNSNKSPMAITPSIQNNIKNISNITVHEVANLKNEEDKNIKDSMECKKIVATETKLEPAKSSPTLLKANPPVVKKDTRLNHEDKSFPQHENSVPYERKCTEYMPTTNYFPNTYNENIASINTQLAHHGSHGYVYSFYNNFSNNNSAIMSKGLHLENEGGNYFPRRDYSSGTMDLVKDKKYLKEIEAFLKRVSKDTSVKNERREIYRTRYSRNPDSYDKSYSKGKINDYRVTPNHKTEASQKRANYQQSKTSYSSSKSYSSEKINLSNTHETKDFNHKKSKENDGSKNLKFRCSEEKQKCNNDENKTNLKRKNRASSSSSSRSSSSSSSSSSTSTCSSQRTKEKNMKKSPYRKNYQKSKSPYRKSYDRSEQKVQKNTYSKITKKTEIYKKTKINERCNSLKSQYSEEKAKHHENEKKRKISSENSARSKSNSSSRSSKSSSRSGEETTTKNKPAADSTTKDNANKYKTVKKRRERSHSSNNNKGYRDRSPPSSSRMENHCNKSNAKASDRNTNDDKTLKKKFTTVRESRESSRGRSYNKGNTDRSPHSSHRIEEHCDRPTLKGTDRNTDDDKTTKSKSGEMEEMSCKILKKKIKALKNLYEYTKVSKNEAKKTSKVKERSQANAHTSLERYTQNECDGNSDLSTRIKSVVDVINNCVHDKFDLRTKLSRKNSILQKKLERENLVVTVTNDQQDEPVENLTISKAINDQNASKARAKKFKKIQLVINVICEKSESSHSEDEAKNKVNGKCPSSNKDPSEDLSFLDDLNVDEIVKSLTGSSSSEILGINTNNNMIDHIIISDDESDASTVHLEELNDSDIQIIDEYEIKREVENSKHVGDQGTRVYTKYCGNNTHNPTLERNQAENMPGATVPLNELKLKHFVQNTSLPSIDATTNLVNSTENEGFNIKFVSNNMEKDEYNDIKIPTPMISIHEIKKEPLDNITESSTTTNSLVISSRDPVIHKNKDKYKDINMEIPKPMISIDEIKEEPLDNIAESNTDTNSLQISSRDPIKPKNKKIKIPEPMICIDQIKEEPLDNVTDNSTDTSLEISSRDLVTHKNKGKHKDMKIPKPMISIDEIKEEPLNNNTDSITVTTSLEISSRGLVKHKSVSNLNIIKMTDDQNITLKDKLLTADLKLKPRATEINTVPSGHLNKVLEKETSANLDSIKINTELIQTDSNPLISRNDANALNYNCAKATKIEAKSKNDKVITGPNATERITVLSENSSEVMENNSRDAAPDSKDLKTKSAETDNRTIHNSSTVSNANCTKATEKEADATIDMEHTGSNILYQETNFDENSKVKDDKFNTPLQQVTGNIPHVIINTKMTDTYNCNKNKHGNSQSTTENLTEECDDKKKCGQVTTNVEGSPTLLETQENIAMLKEKQDIIPVDCNSPDFFVVNNTRGTENVNISYLKEKNTISLNSPLNKSVPQNVSDLNIPDAKDNSMIKKNNEILDKTKPKEQPQQQQQQIENTQLHNTKTKYIADKKNIGDLKSINENQLHVKTDTKEEEIKKSVNPKSNRNNSSVYVKSTALKIKTPNPANKIAAPSPSGTKIIGSNTHKCTPEIRLTETSLVLDLKRCLLNHFNIPYDVITLIHLGKFSKIYSCKNSHGHTYTAKLVRRKYPYDGNVIDNILKSIQSEIPKENLFLIHHVDSFYMKNQWCILMDFYPQNLSQALKETDKVFHINLIQQLTKQLVSAVTVLRNNNIIHTDIKPSHILLNTSNDHLKLCGFDQASLNELDPTIMVGTVNYRAPELILGYPAGFGIDVWSTALVMFEMATRRQLFPGIYSNDILFKQMCTLEYMPFDMITQSRLGKRHFQGTVFKRRTGNKGQMVILKSDHEFFRNNILRSSIKFAYWKSWGCNATKKNKERDLAKLSAFGDLLEQMLTMHPDHRIPIEYVYANPFLLQIT